MVQKAQSYGISLGFLCGVKEQWESKLDPAKGETIALELKSRQPEEK